jgi:hypothetical protein
MEALPDLVRVNAIFEVYDAAAWKYAECVKANEPHAAALHLQVLAKMDSWFAEKRFEQ